MSKSWDEIFSDVLKANDIRLVTYVPDRVLTPLIERVERDNSFIAFSTAREEEALGIVSGAWMAGMRGIILIIFGVMLTSKSPLGNGGQRHHDRSPTVRPVHVDRHPVGPGAHDPQPRSAPSRPVSRRK